METTSSGFPTSSRYIHLNVGGVVYMTSQETLTRYEDSMLGNMFIQENIPLATDDQGRFLIDRDGTVFGYILNFLRDGTLNLPRNFKQYNQLLAEARFYGLDELVKRMSIHLNVNRVHYMTTKSILTRFVGSSLRELFSKDPIPLGRDREGRYILEGDGDLFQYILNFLGDDDLHLPAKFEKFTELDKEAQRYKLEAVSKALNVHLIVGGQDFSSPRATLISVRYIIQRNPRIFKCILNYLETQKWDLKGCYQSYREIQEEVDYYKLEVIMPQHKCGLEVQCTMGDGTSQSYWNFFSTAWKYLTKYRGSLLEEKFADAQGGSQTVNLQLNRLVVDYRDMYYVIRFLETGNLAHAPQTAYPKMLAIAIHLRLEELQRLLNE